MKNTLPLENKRVAILATDGFEQAELLEPQRALHEAGAATEIISLQPGKIRAWNVTDWGKDVPVDHVVTDVTPDDYDALLLPGGVMNPDKLRRNPDVLQFVIRFFDQGKPVAAICHGPWTLIDAGVVRGRKMTSYESIQSDLKNAGALWSDQPVIVDRGLITSRTPDDLPDFNHNLIEQIAQNIPQPQPAATHN